MRVVSVAGGHEKIFYEYVSKDPLDYYFFILDWEQQRDQTKIMLAIENEHVVGSVLVYADLIVQFRGKREAIEQLLEHVSLEKAEMQAPLDCEDIILEKYQPLSPYIKHNLTLMRLNKGEESILIAHPPERLRVEDAEEVLGVLGNADPEVWGEIAVEMLKKSLESTFWLGIRQKNRIVSVGNTRLVDFAYCNIGKIATDEHHRNRGYATSLVSALVQEIFKHSKTALIHALQDNTPAICAYSKVGFEPYNTYLFMKAKKIGN